VRIDDISSQENTDAAAVDETHQPLASSAFEIDTAHNQATVVQNTSYKFSNKQATNWKQLIWNFTLTSAVVLSIVQSFLWGNVYIGCTLTIVVTCALLVGAMYIDWLKVCS
jgi:hypothetical protein